MLFKYFRGSAAKINDREDPAQKDFRPQKLVTQGTIFSLIRRKMGYQEADKKHVRTWTNSNLLTEVIEKSVHLCEICESRYTDRLLGIQKWMLFLSDKDMQKTQST